MKINTTLRYTILVALGLLGAWLTGLFEPTDFAQEVSGRELFLAAVGFFIFIVAIGGLLWLIRRGQKSIQEEELTEWIEVRKQGRRRYLKQLVLKGLAAGIIAISWPLVSEYARTRSIAIVMQSIWIYASIVVACAVAMYYLGVRTWKNYEEVLERRRERLRPRSE